MATLLLIVIYIAFIGLGLPDSLFGTAWPAMHIDLGVSISFGALLTTFITFGTMLSSYFSARVINKFGTRNVVVVSTILTAIGILGYSLSNNVIIIFISSIPMGLGAGAIDTGLNNYVALHYKSMHMNFLHCFYGIGVSLSPYIMAFSLADNDNWRKGYLIAFIIQVIISLILLISIPLWNKNKTLNESEEEKPVTLSFVQMMRTPYIFLIAMLFFLYCVIEASCGAWGASFLVGVKNVTTSKAAEMAGLFFIGLSLGRFISGLVANIISKFKLIFISEALIILALILMIIPINNVTFAGISLLLIGLGCGPIFPNLSAMTPEHFGAKYSQSIMGIQLTFSYVGFFTLSPLLGVLGDVIGFEIFPYYLLVIAVIVLAISVVIRINKNKEKSIFGLKDK